MKYVMTILCSLAFAICGIGLAITDSKESATNIRGNAIHASTLPVNGLPKLPLDLQLDLEKKYTKTDTVLDTVYVPQELVVVNSKSPKYKTKSRSAHTRESTSISRRNLRSPVVEPDPIVKNQVCGDREENSPDTIGPPKESIILIVDGKEVYKR